MAKSLTLPTYMNCFSSIKSCMIFFFFLAMDSCYRSHISLGYNMAGRIHFVLAKGREKKNHTGLGILPYHKIATCILQLITVLVKRKKKKNLLQ